MIEELQKKIREGEVTSEHLVEKYLERIKELNPKYHAVISINTDALFEARARDAEAKVGKYRGPLHGIPIIIKDNIDLKNTITTAGSYALKDNFSEEDATLVKKLKEAGAVIIAKANLTEMANFISFKMPNGYSFVGGQTKNARGNFDTGGSSSGSAVAVALDLCAAAVGTETSGSIISPSSSNGVVGHKPTTGTISRHGIVPISKTQDTAGPITKTVKDAFILFSVMIGYDPEDPATWAFKNYKPSFREIEDYHGMKFGYSEKVASHLPEEHAKIFENALKNLEKLGAKVVKTEFEHLDKLSNIEVLFYEFSTSLKEYLRGKSSRMKTLNDMIKFNLSNPKVIPYGQSIFLKASTYDINDPDYIEYLLSDRLYSRKLGIDKIMKEHDLEAIIFPANYGVHIPAKAGYPSINVPAGFSEKEGPFGITFTGSFLDDEKLYSLADVYYRKYSRQIYQE